MGRLGSQEPCFGGRFRVSKTHAVSFWAVRIGETKWQWLSQKPSGELTGSQNSISPLHFKALESFFSCYEPF